MNPLRVHAANYRTFETLDLDLPTGCVAILGENGAGKSSIVNLIDLAIFGPDSRTLADHHSDFAADGDDLLIELELEHAGELYRIRRTYQARGRGKTTLDLEAWTLAPSDGEPGMIGVASAWEPLTRESAKETQALIEQLLGLSRDTFRASAFLAQGDGAAFTEAQPRDRKRILAEVLGLDRYDHLLARAKTELRTLNEQLQQLDGRTATARDLVAGKGDVERAHAAAEAAAVEAADLVADRERDHQRLADEWQAARDQQASRQTLEAEVRELKLASVTLEERATAARDAGEAITILEPQLTDLEQQAQRLPALLAAAEAAREARAAYEAAAAAARDAEARRDDLLTRALTLAGQATGLHIEANALEEAPLDDSARCDHCGQVLGVEGREQRLAKYRQDAEALDSEAAKLREQAQTIEIPAVPDRPSLAVGDPEPARRAGIEAAKLRERLEHLRAQATAAPADDEVARSQAAWAVKVAALSKLAAVDIAAIEQQGLAAKRALDDARAAESRAAAERTRLDERLRQVAAAEQQLADAAGERARLQQQVDVVAVLERAFSPNGIPILIVESTAIPYLETEATRILAELGTSYRVELRTQAALKTGDGLRDTLDVIVCTEQGERAYETFSGGERTRINLALRIALARLLAHRRGAESRLLAIDEPEFLDEPGTAALVTVLRGLEAEFDRLYLISHVPALRDSFDQVLTVTRAGDRSIVSDGYQAAPPEEVLA